MMSGSRASAPGIGLASQETCGDGARGDLPLDGNEIGFGGAPLELPRAMTRGNVNAFDVRLAARRTMQHPWP